MPEPRPAAAPAAQAEPPDGARHPKAAWWLACALDVAVCKPGNVSVHSEGHRMQASQFLDSAAAAADPICAPGSAVGARIQGAVAATWTAVDCNTNLGIVLLCAPLLAAAEHLPSPSASRGWRQRLAHLRAATVAQLAQLTRDDATAAFAAIAQAQPAGLGRVEQADVHAPAQVTLRQAMALAAGRDRIAHQYIHGFDDIFERTGRDWASVLDGSPSGDWWPGWPRQAREGVPPALRPPHALPPVPANAARALQASFLHWLASGPDSHLVRKLGAAPAHRVSEQAREWLARGGPPLGDEQEKAWQDWDVSLKREGWNPGTSADLSVACALVAALVS
jgi:triphosphoribosyl-dephospho-CoA synthase